MNRLYGMKRIIRYILILIVISGVLIYVHRKIVDISIFTTVLFRINGHKDYKYWEINYPTKNITPNKCNNVEGVILHHTACASIMVALNSLAPKNGDSDISCHVVIDTDGTRYLLASPDRITWHAGASSLNGMDWCNNFTIGVEFQGNTIEGPLSDEQIDSAVEYLLPIIEKYDIPLHNIVTHEYVRANWLAKYPYSNVLKKRDITNVEYNRLIYALKDSLLNKGLR